MNCKKCTCLLTPDALYCGNCGAKVVEERISLKMIRDDFMEESLGWDGKFFLTIRGMVFQPATVISEYISGTRNKYIKPFTFFAIGAAMALFIFNVYSEEYLRMMQVTEDKQPTVMQLRIEKEVEKKASERGDVFDLKGFREKQKAENERFQRDILSNWNFVSFLLLPLYALMALWSFGKPYNYAEHLVAGAYIQGVTFILTAICFLLSLKTNPAVFVVSMVLTVLLYVVVYQKLYRLKPGQLILALVKFAGISIVFGFVLVLIGGVIGSFMQ